MSHTHQGILERIEIARAKGLTELDFSRDLGLDLSLLGSEQALTEIPPEVFELRQLEILNLRNNSITTIPRAISQLKNLRVLDLSLNNLTTIPSWVGELPHLRELDLGFNELTSLPTTLSRSQSLTRLRLSQNNWTEIPTWISELQNLEEIELNFVGLTAVPKWIAKLRNLRNLGLTGNQLTTLPIWITHLPKLSALDISGNNLTSLPDWIGDIQTLEELDLNHLSLDKFPEWISKLKNLKRLDLIDNRVISVPEWLSDLENLNDLNLSGNELTFVPEAVCQLTNLEILWLFRNRLFSIPDSIRLLQNLTQLSCDSNQLTTLPSSMALLRRLKLLYLGNNSFEFIPEVIYEISTLEDLKLDNSSYKDKHENKNRIKVLSPKILQLESLTQISLEDNPIETPPPEIVNNGVDAIKKYFKQIEAQGTDFLFEAKLLIVGEGDAGKTSLAKKIEDSTYELRDEDSTKGIAVSPWTFKMVNGQPFRVNIWDFGGQEIYHSTHQFFLTKRSLYILVADTRKEDTDFYYWLNVVELLSDNSPILIVKNEKKDRHREINVNQLRGQFSNLEKTLPTNLATNRGLDNIVEEIKHYITHLPQIGAPLPKNWVKVREALEKETRNYIPLSEYFSVCQKMDLRT